MSGTDPFHAGDAYEPDEDLGMDLVDQVAEHGDGSRPRPLKKWMLVVAALAIVLIGGAILLTNLLPKDFTSMTEGAKDKAEQSQPVEGGGTATLMTSAAKDTGTVTLAGLPVLPNNESYVLWLTDAKTDAPSVLTEIPSAGQGATAGFKGNSAIGTVILTVEPAEGSQTPSAEPLVTFELNDDQ
ncbi:anti-sigma factor [Paeniglutamicibacter cryotolerans]|uniref:Anti-sigma K factor RskA C-terminal domain-containing protein n=1 Tax=Paeniglutamicibacter cryotolerans TaxID=670079 RepID=A0A839QPL9_9MICC|nr:anti-sigma factor [Paeniglutamicibacter cryotolerans]MBB2996585.1 hypothetical protein [Paeniglutamicibacter cryotolerans]